MFEIYLIIIAYLGLTIWFAIEGNKRKIGATKSFIISLLLTPIIGFIVVFNSKKIMSYFVYQYKCSRCNYEFTEQQEYCPLCAKEGERIRLKKVTKEMT